MKRHFVTDGQVDLILCLLSHLDVESRVSTRPGLLTASLPNLTLDKRSVQYRKRTGY